ncbi:MAG: hypothetical protein ACD_20C00172G0016 [uncultured bacterium]|nr:MAG: hypothetical protein ACD_20C00172G0016 [uncultured bacterium]HBH18156.1 hypothetical protein [Cyanobacteria bacterium UBA9579]
MTIIYITALFKIGFMKNSLKYLFIFSMLISVIMAGIGISYAKKPPNNTEIKPPNLKFEYYNLFPGGQELNLFGIEKKREIVGPGIISPDMEKVAYSEVYFYPQNNQFSSKIFYVTAGPLDVLDNLSVTLSPSELANIFAVKKVDNSGKVIIKSGSDSFDSQIFRTLTIIDWSNDSKKLLVKETVGEHLRGIWATNLWVYDFDVKKARKLDEIRKAVTYYWKTKYHLRLYDYRWDIIPLGWDTTNPEMIVVNAYGYNRGKKEFLGCWGIDFRGRRSQLLSLDDENWPVEKNGLVIVDK